MKFYRELNDSELERCVVATYYIESNPEIGTLKDACWNLAIGQSVGNPNVRNSWETDELFENHSCVIYDEENKLNSLHKGTVKIGFPSINTDWDGDGISHLLCQLMGGQLDINVFKVCRLIDIKFPKSIEDKFLKPKYGITGIREFTKQYDKPLSGAILKPKTGMSPKTLENMVKELLDGDVDFIKEDEILSNPSFCRLEDRVELISNLLAKNNKKIIYSFCVNGDHHAILDRCKFVSDNGGNSVHINFWSGLGVYNSIRKMDLPLFVHFQKSGEKILTSKQHNFGIDWRVICDLAGLMGVDTIHAGMIGGYANDPKDEINEVLNTLYNRNVLPALSCGMHPGIVQSIVNTVGNNFIANCGGAIHGHPGGTVSGAKAMRQAIDKSHQIEYHQAIEKWGLIE